MAVEVSFLGLNCQDCHNNEALKKFRGCEKPTERVQYIRDGEELHRCPASVIPRDMNIYIELYAYYKKGMLPFEGGVSKQPAKLMEIFSILESAENRAEKKKIEG